MSDKVYENDSNNKRKSTWREDKAIRYINPYNFVPFAEKCERSELKIDYKNSYTGVMECSLEVITPLIIPNTTCDMALHKDEELKNELQVRTSSDDISTEKHSYDFASYFDLKVENEGKDFKSRKNRVFEPVIHATSINGSVRSVHEAAFGGCMSSVTINRDLGRRTLSPKKLGILKKKEILLEDKTTKEQWVLVPCRQGRQIKVKIETEGCVSPYTYKKSKEGEMFRVYYQSKNGVNKATKCVRVGKDDMKNAKMIAYLHKGEPFKEKKYESFFQPFVKNNDSYPNEILISNEEILNLQKVINEYKNRKGKTKDGETDHSGYEEYKFENILKDNPNSVLPVYYCEDEYSKRHMCPACIGREVFYNTMEELLKYNGEFISCESSVNLCPTCKIFGMVSKENVDTLAIASRIRFTDAVLERKENNYLSYFEEPVVLPELGEPKSGTAEFYTYVPFGDTTNKNCDVKYWTYDYYMKKSNKNPKKMIRKPIPAGKLKLRGRKFYWHSDSYKEILTNKQELTAMKQRVRPLKCTKENNNKFIFKVYFENLTLQELKQLKWALDFNDTDCAHKIGRAKPFGFGSVRIQVSKVKLRTIDIDDGQWKLVPTKIDLMLEEQIIHNNQEIQSLKSITNLKTISKLKKKNPSAIVAYPIGVDETIEDDKENREAGHQWFNGNRTMGQNGSMNLAFYKVLPTIQEELEKNSTETADKWLYKLKKK